MSEPRRIDRPGVHDLPAETYHSDPCPEPSLSSGVGKLLVERSPLHAWHAHPRLNPDAIQKRGRNLDVGSAAHSMVLGSPLDIEVIDAADYRKKTTQDQRDAAIEAGRTPLLNSEYDRCRAIYTAIRNALPDDVFANGKPEQTLIWQERNGIWCRARLDWLPDDGWIFDDLKTTEGSAHPDMFGKRLFEMGYDFQAAFYLRGLAAVFGHRNRRFRFVAVEAQPPHGCSIVEVEPASLALAGRKVATAIHLWGECLSAGRWPGYPPGTHLAETPPWIENRWIAREQLGESEVAAAIALQAP